MSTNNIIAIWGNPGAGKTTLACKLAKGLANKRKNVIIISSDTLSPAVQIISPHTSVGAEKSLGSLFASPTITQELILSKCVTLSKNEYISIMGYVMGENVYTYPQYSQDKAVDFLISVKHLADYIIVDCPSNFAEDVFSVTAIEMADSVIRLCSTSLAAVSYFSSNLPLLADRKFNTDDNIKILSNVRSNEPKEHIKELLRGVEYELLHTWEIASQMLNGELFNVVKSHTSMEYIDVVNRIINQVVGYNLNSKNEKQNTKDKHSGNVKKEKKSIFRKLLYKEGASK
jgi:MinD-like ATPase involved in chromosome partitioning or flagellar assembly